MKIVAGCSDYLLHNQSGINTFLKHLKTLASNLNHEFEIVTEEHNFKSNADVIVTNDLRSYYLARNSKAKMIDYNHIGDVIALKDNSDEMDFETDSVFEYVFAQSQRKTNYVIHESIKDVFDKFNVETNILPLPYYHSHQPKQEQEGIIIIAGDYIRKRIRLAMQLIPNDIPVTLLCNTPIETPDNWTVKTVNNNEVSKEIARHKMLFLPSSIEMYPYVMLEAVMNTRVVLMPHTWNKKLPYDKITTTEELVQLYNQEYRPLFDIDLYTAETEKQWKEIFND